MKKILLMLYIYNIEKSIKDLILERSKKNSNIIYSGCSKKDDQKEELQVNDKAKLKSRDTSLISIIRSWNQLKLKLKKLYFLYRI